ncbi:MAG: YggS family pyridoxal phosphate-dependent enzyme, partial [Lachnospiraceae bacterium]|nr:YggS family pyridoxal phosphate-dependent enzyme [Lachnospiraceae bacterium]
RVAGRDPESVTLIAVSKTHPASDVMKAYELGVRDFGENKVQELMDKYDKLPRDIRWHMIGHLQKNKVKYLIGKVCLIHSVDSFELAKVIDKESAKNGLVTDILIEVNVSGEESKFGVAPKDLCNLLKEISLLPNVRVKGLMTVAPYVEDAEQNRQHFVTLRQLAIDINSQNIDNICIEMLSMGMSGDYEVAVQEGASFVRVGTGIFGARNYNISV